MGAMVTTERKYFDTFLSNASITNAATWAGSELDPAAQSTLFSPSEGSDIDNRVVRKNSVLAIKIRGWIKVPAQADQTALDTFGNVRLILYQDKQTNGVQSQGEQLMADPGAATVSLCASTFQNLANFGRFRVLKDKIYRLPDPNSSYDGTNIEVGGFTIPFKMNCRFRVPEVVRFNGTNGGTVADVIDNSWHLIGLSTSTVAANIDYSCRVVYLDA
jgi:hypothetical protein